jgi:hypothetical protein
MIGLDWCGADAAGRPLAGCAFAGAVAIDKTGPFDDVSGASEVAQQGKNIGQMSADIGVLFLQTLQCYTNACLRQLHNGKLLPRE